MVLVGLPGIRVDLDFKIEMERAKVNHFRCVYNKRSARNDAFPKTVCFHILPSGTRTRICRLCDVLPFELLGETEYYYAAIATSVLPIRRCNWFSAPMPHTYLITDLIARF